MNKFSHGNQHVLYFLNYIVHEILPYFSLKITTWCHRPEAEFPRNLLIDEDITSTERPLICVSAFSCASISWLTSGKVAYASEGVKMDPVYEVGELFELGIQLSYVLLLLGLLGVGTFFVIRQVLVRRELDLSAKELQASKSILSSHFVLS